MKRAACALLVLALAACRSTSVACGGGAPVPPRNFGETGDLLRGAQPRSCAELDYLAARGVKTIVALNGASPTEIAAAEERGIRVLPFAFHAQTIGTPATCAKVAKVLDVLREPANRPLYVHCTAGRDRTGYIVGLYEKLVLGEPEEQVLAELAAHGHRGWYRLVFGQIDRELQSPAPACGMPR